MLGQFLRFAIVGTVAGVVQYAILIALVQLAHLNPVIGTACGFCVAAVVSYSLNRHFTFDHRPVFARGLMKFFVVGAVGLAINVGVVALLVALRVHYLVAQLVATAVALIWNYCAARFVVFREPDVRST
jgi:putative flippase GtrA